MCGVGWWGRWVGEWGSRGVVWGVCVFLGVDGYGVWTDLFLTRVQVGFVFGLKQTVANKNLKTEVCYHEFEKHTSANINLKPEI